MRSVQASSIVFLLACASLSPAHDDRVPNTLTAEEIKQGWILLFDGKTSFGWKVEGEAAIKDGVLSLGGNQDSSITATSRFGHFELVCDLLTTANEQPGKLECQCSGNRIAVSFRTYQDWVHASATRDDQQLVLIQRDERGRQSSKVTTSVSGTATTTIRFVAPAGSTLKLKNIRLKPTGLDSIFNGKDLSGWKVIPEKPSVFSVTPTGEINVKNGPGDLQSEGQWDDFVLQLEVISNGKHLNSGVFFRAIPGEFWSGYESQIRNQWKGEDRDKPVDFGTGGLYGREPARKVISSDKEWFTKTVLADGDHIAIWINGYQTVDHIDAKPDAPSARKGRKLGKGSISLQGHDPTTDLSFRNIRIGELGK